MTLFSLQHLLMVGLLLTGLCPRALRPTTRRVVEQEGMGRQHSVDCTTLGRYAYGMSDVISGGVLRSVVSEGCVLRGVFDHDY